MFWFSFVFVILIVFIIIKCKQIKSEYEQQYHAAILQSATRRKLSIRTPPIKRPKKRVISPPHYDRPFKSTKLD